MPWNSLWSNITDGGAYHVADNNVIIKKIYYIGNEFRVSKSDYLFEIDMQDVVDHDSYAFSTCISNTFGDVNTSVMHTTNSPYYKVYSVDNILSTTPVISSGSVACVNGFDHGWFGNQVLTGLTLSQSPVSYEGAIWYNTTANKIEFYNGAAVETVTSA